MATTDVHPDGLRCPRCRSTNVVCHGRPHGHECQDCGYDGTTLDPLAQALGLLRSHADVCSRYGESDRLRAEADRIESLAGVAAGPQATPDRVLWEGETRMVMHTDPSLNGTTSYIPSPDAFDVPPGTRVRVVAVPTDPDDHPAP